MKKIAVGLLVITFSLISMGCVRAPFTPPMGAITTVKAPLDVDYNETAVSPKKGISSVTTILGLFSFGDASTQTAAKDGGITTIDHADYDYTNILGIYQKTSVIVYGK